MGVYGINGSSLQSVYNAGGQRIDTAYDLAGNVIFDSGTHQKDYNNYEISNMFVYSISNAQAFAVYGGKIAQVKETDSVHILDIATKSKIKEVAMDVGHGNSCQFSSEFYATGDEFPLFYVRNAGIWVYRIVGTSSELVKKYTFPSDVIATYVAGFGVDSENQRIYTVSYTQGDYISKTGMVRIAVWDMSNATDNGNNVLTPTLIDYEDYEWWDSYDAIQGCCYHNGYLFIGTGYTNVSTQHVVMVDENDLSIAYTISIPGGEIEGCAWVADDYMIVQQRPNATYKKVEFADV